MVGAPPNPLEVVEAAVGVVDLAWTAIEKHRDHASHEVAWEEGVHFEAQLARERSENHRLKAALLECQNALRELQSGTPCPVASAAGVANCTLDSSSECPSDLYEQLKKKVDSPAFLERLNELHQRDSDGSSTSVKRDGDEIMLKADPEDPSWWLWITDDLFTSDGKEEPDCLENDSFVIVNQDDVIDGVAIFIAKLIVSNPTAKKMTPKEVQEAVSMSFTRMEKKGRLRKLWAAAKFLYVSASWTAAAVGLYKNPLIMKGILKALTMSSRLIIRILA